MRSFASTFSLAIGAAVLIGSLSTGCFSEIRSIQCSDNSQCFAHEQESCVDGRCTRILDPDAGGDDADDNDADYEGSTVSGTVNDSHGTPLISATICDGPGTGDSTVSDGAGNFMIFVESGKVKASYPDHRTEVIEVHLESETVHFNLESCDTADCAPGSSPPPCP